MEERRVRVRIIGQVVTDVKQEHLTSKKKCRLLHWTVASPHALLVNIILYLEWCYARTTKEESRENVYKFRVHRRIVS